MAITAVLCLATAGCGTGPLAVSSTEPTEINISGTVYGGQQPINQGQIFLSQVGNTGSGSVAANLLTSSVYTNARGYFNLNGKYSGTDTQRPVYIVSSGGDPGSPTFLPVSLNSSASPPRPQHPCCQPPTAP